MSLLLIVLVTSPGRVGEGVIRGGGGTTAAACGSRMTNAEVRGASANTAAESLDAMVVKSDLLEDVKYILRARTPCQESLCSPESDLHWSEPTLSVKTYSALSIELKRV